jgi:plasmid stabilization system protein ParE
MDFKIEWTEPAIDCLRDIVQEVASDNAPAALRLGMALMDRMDVTIRFPRSGPLYSAKDSVEIRCLTLGNYRLYYQLGAKPGVVEVLAVRHTSREQPEF